VALAARAEYVQVVEPVVEVVQVHAAPPAGCEWVRGRVSIIEGRRGTAEQQCQRDLGLGLAEVDGGVNQGRLAARAGLISRRRVRLMSPPDSATVNRTAPQPFPRHQAVTEGDGAYHPNGFRSRDKTKYQRARYQTRRPIGDAPSTMPTAPCRTPAGRIAILFRAHARQRVPAGV